MIKTLFATLTRNLLGLVGVVLAGVAAVLIVLLAAFGAVGAHGGSFLAILTFLVLPGVLVAGLVLIPVGLWWQHRGERVAAARGGGPPSLPVIDLNRPTTRGALIVALLLGLAALVILAGAGYKGVEVLESTEFCGQACHVSMQPEATAHMRSPHANVACVHCHVGPGASAFVKSKINGLRELVEVVFDSYARPIPTPIHTLRPAPEVCEECHWPTKFVGDKLVIRSHYGEDEANSPTKTVLMLHVGGQVGKAASGIHWHVGKGVSIRYLSDHARETIYTVELTAADGSVKTFKTAAAPPVDAEWRTMDCIDCHNRPSHVYREPANEIDAALADGRIDTSLPYVKREGLRVLKADYASESQARAAIQKDIEGFYRAEYPAITAERAAAVTQAGKALGDIWSWNVFPLMKVTWNTYPNHIGHQQSPGCQRCHDNKHLTETSEKISKKCDTCHNVIAENEAAPEVLKALE
jgi:nitrate/TMAO reductase-like tetraheme cytochrome c subunit